VVRSTLDVLVDLGVNGTVDALHDNEKIWELPVLVHRDPCVTNRVVGRHANIVQALIVLGKLRNVHALDFLWTCGDKLVKCLERCDSSLVDVQGRIVGHTLECFVFDGQAHEYPFLRKREPQHRGDVEALSVVIRSVGGLRLAVGLGVVARAVRAGAALGLAPQGVRARADQHRDGADLGETSLVAGPEGALLLRQLGDDSIGRFGHWGLLL